MEDLDIIRHVPRSSPTAGRPTPVDGRAAETVIGLCSPAERERLSRSSESPRPGFEDRGRAAEYNQ